MCDLEIFLYRSDPIVHCGEYHTVTEILYDDLDALESKRRNAVSNEIGNVADITNRCIIGLLENVALGKPTTQDPINDSVDSGRAGDVRTSGVWTHGNVMHTKSNGTH